MTVTTRKNTIVSLMLQLAGFITFVAATFISAFSSGLFSSAFRGASIYIISLLLLITPSLGCPPSCECSNTTVLEVYCKNGRLLTIFTQIDSATYALTLDNVVDLRIIKKDRIQDLNASEVVTLKITASLVEVSFFFFFLFFFSRYLLC